MRRHGAATLGLMACVVAVTSSHAEDKKTKWEAPRLEIEVTDGTSPVVSASVFVRQVRRHFTCSLSSYGDWTPTRHGWEVSRALLRGAGEDIGQTMNSRTTDGMGRASVAVDGGMASMFVTVSSPGFGTRRESVTSFGSSKRLVVALEPEATLTGQVLDPDGVGLAAATVSVFETRDGESLLLAQTTTDREGRYKIGELGASTTYSLQVQTARDDLVDAQRSVTTKLAGDVKLERAGAVSIAPRIGVDAATINSVIAAAAGRKALVLGGDGTSASGMPWSGRVNAELTVERRDGVAWTEVASAAYRLDLANDHALPDVRIEKLAPGTHRVRLQATAFTSVASEPFELEVGKTPRVELALRFPKRSVKLRVMRPDGIPLSGASVGFTSEDEHHILSSNDDGRVVVAGVPRSPAFLLVTAPGFRDKAVNIAPEVDDLGVVTLELK